jgi:hypothetical protein
MAVARQRTAARCAAARAGSSRPGPWFGGRTGRYRRPMRCRSRGQVHGGSVAAAPAARRTGSFGRAALAASCTGSLGRCRSRGQGPTGRFAFLVRSGTSRNGGLALARCGTAGGRCPVARASGYRRAGVSRLCGHGSAGRLSRLPLRGESAAVVRASVGSSQGPGACVRGHGSDGPGAEQAVPVRASVGSSRGPGACVPAGTARTAGAEQAVAVHAAPEAPVTGQRSRPCGARRPVPLRAPGVQSAAPAHALCGHRSAGRRSRPLPGRTDVLADQWSRPCEARRPPRRVPPQVQSAPAHALRRHHPAHQWSRPLPRADRRPGGPVVTPLRGTQAAPARAPQVQSAPAHALRRHHPAGQWSRPLPGGGQTSWRTSGRGPARHAGRPAAGGRGFSPWRAGGVGAWCRGLVPAGRWPGVALSERWFTLRTDVTAVVNCLAVEPDHLRRIRCRTRSAHG